MQRRLGRPGQDWLYQGFPALALVTLGLPCAPWAAKLHPGLPQAMLPRRYSPSVAARMLADFARGPLRMYCLGWAVIALNRLGFVSRGRGGRSVSHSQSPVGAGWAVLSGLRTIPPLHLPAASEIGKLFPLLPIDTEVWRS